MPEPETILQRLEEHELQVLVEQGGRLLFASDRDGFTALVDSVFETPELYDGSDVALPAAGLAAACVLVHAKVGRVFIGTITYEARRFLGDEGIEHESSEAARKLTGDHAAAGALDEVARESVTVAAFIEELKRQRL